MAHDQSRYVSISVSCSPGLGRCGEVGGLGNGKAMRFQSWIWNHGMGESLVATRDIHVRTVRWMRNKYLLYVHLCVFWIPLAIGADFI